MKVFALAVLVAVVGCSQKPEASQPTEAPKPQISRPLTPSVQPSPPKPAAPTLYFSWDAPKPSDRGNVPSWYSNSIKFSIPKDEFRYYFVIETVDVRGPRSPFRNTRSHPNLLSKSLPGGGGMLGAWATKPGQVQSFEQWIPPGDYDVLDTWPNPWSVRVYACQTEDISLIPSKVILDDYVAAFQKELERVELDLDRAQMDRLQAESDARQRAAQRLRERLRR